VALFNQQLVQMQSGYYQHVDKIEKFIPVGDLIASRSNKDRY